MHNNKLYLLHIISDYSKIKSVILYEMNQNSMCAIFDNIKSYYNININKTFKFAFCMQKKYKKQTNPSLLVLQEVRVYWPNILLIISMM